MMKNTEEMSPLFTNSFTKTSRIIYTPSVWARSNLLTLQETGKLTALKSHLSRRSGLNSYLFFLVQRGAGEVSYRKSNDSIEKRTLREGDCFFVDCRREYTQAADEENPWTLSWVHFIGPSAAAVYEKYLSRNGSFAFSAKRPERYGELLAEIYELAAGESYVRDMEINTKLNQLLEYLLQETVSETGYDEKEGLGQRQSVSKKLDIQKAKIYIDNHYTEKISLETVAEKFFISKFYFSKMFKECYGISVNHYILQLRITKAKGLLRFGGEADAGVLSMEEIAAGCGFEDANYFSRMFKKVEGISPSQYRKNW